MTFTSVFVTCKGPSETAPNNQAGDYEVMKEDGIRTVQDMGEKEPERRRRAGVWTEKNSRQGR
jgi:hypothetical protein